jgi:hypothetical protein
MRIRMSIEGTPLTATLDDNVASRDFASLLPLALTLTDYAATEKISDLPRRLSTEETPPGSEPAVGTLAYYAPWGNLALFYRDAGYANGLVRLGTITSGMDVLKQSGPLEVDIQLLEADEGTDG